MTESSARNRSSGGCGTGTSGSVESDYTEDQVRDVHRLKHCRDYYQLLGVPKTTSLAELKKNYKKLALQFHPDKNKAPGATDVFKSIGNAYGVLSDPDKRRRYDQYGEEGPNIQRRTHRAYHDMHHGFEAEFDPNDIFNVFFGGFGGTRVYTYSTNSRSRYQNESYDDSDVSPSYAIWFQLSPILLLFLMSIFSALLTSDPLFSLSLQKPYTVVHTTSNLKIPYYVKLDFERTFKSSLARLEREVENEYLQVLQNKCYHERHAKENMRQKGRYFRDASLINRADKMTTPHCDKLKNAYAGG